MTEEKRGGKKKEVAEMAVSAAIRAKEPKRKNMIKSCEHLEKGEENEMIC
jgi:hypothetical protein